MARDLGRRGRDEPDPTPVDQLDTWRTWRHDTAEFPAVPSDGGATDHRDHGVTDPYVEDRYADRYAGDSDYADAPSDRVRAARRRRPGPGLLAGAALLLVALVVSGLAAVGVGPVAHLLGSGSGDDRPSGTTSTTSPSTGSSTANGSSAGTSSNGSTSGGSSTGSSAGGSTAGPAAPSGAPAPNGAQPSGAAPGPAGNAGPGARNGGPGAKNGGPGADARPGSGDAAPLPPAGGPGA